MKRPEKLLVAPMALPNYGSIYNEVYRSITYQLIEAVNRDGADNITFLDFDLEYKLYDLIIGQISYVKSNVNYMNNYDEMKLRFKEILAEHDTVFLYGISCNKIDWGSSAGMPTRWDETVIENELRKCHNSKTYGFQNIGTRKLLPNYLARIIFLESLAEEDVKVIHLTVDMREVDLSFLIDKNRYKRMGALKSTIGPSKPMPYFEWGLENTYVQETGKSYNLYYIGTDRSRADKTFSTNKDRKYLYDICSKVNNGMCDKDIAPNGIRGLFTITDNFYGKDLPHKVHIQIQEKYYYHLKLSKYTFINKPYDGGFNYQRFMEAIVLDCIPFIDANMDIKDLQLTYPEFYDIIKERKLIYSVDNSREMPFRTAKYNDNGDNKIIEEFKKTKAYMALTDINKIRKFWERMLGWKDVRFT